MKNYLNTIGKEIIEEKTGKVLAYINDLIFDTENGKIISVLLSNDKFLYYNNISDWKVRIYAKSDVLFQDIGDLPDVKKILEDEISILGNTVVDEDGIFLGYCEDIVFDEKMGILNSIIVRKYFLAIIPLKKKIISSSEIIEIKKEGIIVKNTKIKDAVAEV